MSSSHSKEAIACPVSHLRGHEPVPDVYRVYIRRERRIGVAINLVLSLAFTALLFPDVGRVPLWGADGMALDLVPTVFMLTLMGSLAVTLVARKRLRVGAIAPLPAYQCGWAARALPGHWALRVVLVAIVVTAAVVPLSVLVLWSCGFDSMSYPQYLGFKAAYGPVVGALSTGVVVRSALRGESRA